MMLRKTLTEILFKECFYAKTVCLNVVESFSYYSANSVVCI